VGYFLGDPELAEDMLGGVEVFHGVVHESQRFSIMGFILRIEVELDEGSAAHNRVIKNATLGRGCSSQSAAQHPDKKPRHDFDLLTLPARHLPVCLLGLQHIQVRCHRQPDVVEHLATVMLLEKVLQPSKEVLQHSQLHCVQQVWFRKVTDHAVKIPEHIRTLVDATMRKTHLCFRSICFTEHSVQGVDPMLVRFDGKLAHLLVRALAPVANTILDIMKVSVFRVVGDPGGGRCNAVPEVAIGTSGIEYLAVRIH